MPTPIDPVAPHCNLCAACGCPEACYLDLDAWKPTRRRPRRTIDILLGMWADWEGLAAAEAMSGTPEARARYRAQATIARLMYAAQAAYRAEWVAAS